MSEQGNPRIFERFDALYPHLINGIVSAGNVVMTFSQTFIISFGILILLTLLMIVEQHGLHDGVAGFIHDTQMATFAAWVIVALNLVVELMVIHIEHKENYKPPRTMAWSLRLWARDLAYRIGRDKTWKPRPQSPAQAFISLRSLLTVGIFMIALMGRMNPAIEKISIDEQTGRRVPYYEGVLRVLTESTLLEMTTWAGSTLFTMLALIGVQKMTHHMGMKVNEVKDELKQRLKNSKAAETRLRNRETRAVARMSTTNVDVYELERLRDNTLQPIKHKRGDKTVYECPECHKEMTRSGWSRHTCRHVNTVAGVNQQALNLLATGTQPAQQVRNVEEVE